MYVVSVGAYIMHDPAGLDTRHVDAVPTDTYPDGHVEFAITIDVSLIFVNPDGQDVVGAVAFARMGNINKAKIIFFIFKFLNLTDR